METKLSEKIELQTWRDIPDYEGLYMASNLGNIKSCKRFVKHSGGGMQVLNETILNRTTCKSGYQTVALSINGEAKTKLVHRLIASAFWGKSKLVIDHKDSDKSNNALSNLRYCTQRDNLCFSKINPGVSINPDIYKKKFRARISISGKLKDLGSYYDIEDAKKAYQTAKNTLQLCQKN